jgi:hypothetical protein
MKSVDSSGRSHLFGQEGLGRQSTVSNEQIRKTQEATTDIFGSAFSPKSPASLKGKPIDLKTDPLILTEMELDRLEEEFLNCNSETELKGLITKYSQVKKRLELFKTDSESAKTKKLERKTGIKKLFTQVSRAVATVLKKDLNSSIETLMQRIDNVIPQLNGEIETKFGKKREEQTATQNPTKAAEEKRDQPKVSLGTANQNPTKAVEQKRDQPKVSLDSVKGGANSEIGTVGLPNSRVDLGLVNVCYINSSVQMIANIPGLKSLVENSHPAEEGVAMKEDLLKLLQVMEKKPASEMDVESASKKFWDTFQTAIIKKGKAAFGLKPGVGQTNSSGEFIAFIGDVLKIAPFENLPGNGIFRTYQVEEVLPKGNGNFFISERQQDSGPVEKRINIQGERFILKGAIHFELDPVTKQPLNHYTCSIFFEDENQWINFNDKSKLPKKNDEIEFESAVVLMYEKG